MKIVYIGNNLKVGNPTTLQTLSNALTKSGFNVKTFGVEKNKYIRLITMVFGVCKHYNASYVLIDTYSTSNFYYALIISQLSRLLRIPYIPILHGGNLPNRLEKNVILSKMIFNNSYENCTPSLFLKKEFKMKSFKTVYIPNILDLEKYKFKERLIITPKLLWVRAFDKIYNPAMAIKLISLLTKNGNQASLCMVGEDKDGSLIECKKLAQKLGVIDNIEFTGYLTKNEWLKKSCDFDVFINTTTIDNIPMSVIEAMALGIPVISTNVGGIPYLIKNCINGFLVENNDVEGMANVITKLTQNKISPFQLRSIITNGRETSGEFTESSILKKWKEILK